MNYFYLTVLSTAALAAALLDCLATPAAATGYEEYLSVVQRQSLQREKRGRLSGFIHCGLFPINVTVQNADGCVGYVPVFGCAGKCRSSETPHYYMARHEANLPNPMISTCKCCSHTRLLEDPVEVDVELVCSEGNSTSTVTKHLQLLLPINCGCRSCA